MSKKIRLQVPEPCHENWEKMTPAGGGRYCGSCQKNVIDFSTMSDREITLFFKKPSTGSVCGRFLQDQLDRDIEMPKKKIPWVKYFFQFALPAFLASGKLLAQGQVKKIFQDTVIMPQKMQLEKTGDDANTKPTGIQEIKGRVLDQDSIGIPRASVLVKGFAYGAVTDDKGDFVLKVPGEISTPVLLISSVGYETTEMPVQQDAKAGPLEIVMLMKPFFAGEVIVVGFINYRSSDDEIPLIEFNDSKPMTQFRVYPNPVIPGSAIQLQMTGGSEGYYNIELITMSGASIHKRKVWMDPKAGSHSLPLPVVKNGVYILRLTNKRTRETFSEKIVIQ